MNESEEKAVMIFLKKTDKYCSDSSHSVEK